MNVFDEKEVKVIKDKGVQPCGHAPKVSMEGVKTKGVKVRGTGAANKRALGNGPPYLKLNGVIRYPIDAFETYLNKHLHHNARYVK